MHSVRTLLNLSLFPGALRIANPCRIEKNQSVKIRFCSCFLSEFSPFPPQGPSATSGPQITAVGKSRRSGRRKEINKQRRTYTFNLGVPPWRHCFSKKIPRFREASSLEFWCSKGHFAQFDLILTNSDLC